MERIEIQKLIKTCEACPAQWEGTTTDDRQIYIRFRWGRLTVSVGEVGDKSEFAAVRGKEIFGKQLSDGFDGTMSENQLRDHLESILHWPRPMNTVSKA